MVWTHLKNISRIGSSPQVGVKIKKIFETTTQYIYIYGTPNKGGTIIPVFFPSIRGSKKPQTLTVHSPQGPSPALAEHSPEGLGMSKTKKEKNWCDLGVSKNNGTPRSSILIGFSPIFTIHFGYHYFWKHSFVVVLLSPIKTCRPTLYLQIKICNWLLKL